MTIVVVTGAAGGIGTAVVDLLTSPEREVGGHRVVAVDRTEPDPGRYARPDAVVPVRADVAQEESVVALRHTVRGLSEDFGTHVHGLVHAAGTVLDAPLLETSAQEWDDVFAVNARGVFLTLREIAGLMIDQRSEDPTNARGIVTVSSNAAAVPRAEFGAYGASKAAASSVAASFGLQLARHGIRSNVIRPGTTRTPMVTDPWQGEDRSALPVAGNPGTFRLGIPLGRIAEPEDIAECAAFLLSERARHTTLQSLTVDGGATF